jgi:hypothetical protein
MVTVRPVTVVAVAVIGMATPRLKDAPVAGAVMEVASDTTDMDTMAEVVVCGVPWLSYARAVRLYVPTAAGAQVKE